MNDHDKYLPGHPPPKLVRSVRRHLASYGIRPQAKLWRLTWEWAATVRRSYVFPSWPIPNEVGSQYVVLLLADMRDHFALRLPHRAYTHAPPAVLIALADTTALPVGRTPKPLAARTEVPADLIPEASGV